MRGASTRGARRRLAARPRPAGPRDPRRGTHRVRIPADRDEIELSLAGRTVHLTNLRKRFWPGRAITKGDLLQYYVDVAPFLLPHLRERAMVMKRYPDGVG